jgi:hypothetical protein
MLQHSDNVGSLAAALAAAQGELQNAHRNSRNPHFRSTYADLAEIINTVRPVLARHGLAVVQVPSYVDGVASVETLLLHSSGEWVAGTSAAPVVKSDPQGVSSAVTYLRRFSLAAIACIASSDQEDDDGNAASAAPAKPKAERAVLGPKPKATLASAEQVDLIRKTMQSSVITDSERAGFDRLLAGGMSKAKATTSIEWLLATIKTRKNEEKT